jgi:hypothetical protein
MLPGEVRNSMKKTFSIKSRGLFDPASDNPFKVSRSGIELFLECPRCFYINHWLGIRRPSGPPFNINSLVDRLLKKEFDVHRANGTAHPLMGQYRVEAVPYQHPKINDRSTTIPNISLQRSHIHRESSDSASHANRMEFTIGTAAAAIIALRNHISQRSNNRTPNSLDICVSHGEARKAARASAAPCSHRLSIDERLNS